MDSPLKLLAYALIATAVLAIVWNLFLAPHADPAKEILNGIKFAQANINTPYSKELTFTQNDAFSARNFEDGTRNVRFLCSSPATCSGADMQITTKTAQAKKTFTLFTHYRCRNLGPIDDCVVYFGQEPASLAISNLSVGSNPTQGKNFNFSFTITNNGKISAAEINYDAKLYFILSEGAATQEVLKQEVPGTIKQIVPVQSQKVELSTLAANSGKHILRIEVESKDGGFASAQKEITVQASAGACKTTDKGTTIPENGACTTPHYCSGCGSGAECSIAWQNRGVVGEITEVFTDKVNVQTPQIDGKCQ